jgi:hypothetical protein
MEETITVNETLKQEYFCRSFQHTRRDGAVYYTRRWFFVESRKPYRERRATSAEARRLNALHRERGWGSEVHPSYRG